MNTHNTTQLKANCYFIGDSINRNRKILEYICSFLFLDILLVARFEWHKIRNDVNTFSNDFFVDTENELVEQN